MLYKIIGKRILDKRIQAHLTQEKLARQAGISLSFLGHIERGTRKLSVDTLYKICMALSCSADELLDTGMYNVDGLTVPQLLRNVIDRLETPPQP